MLFNTLAKCLYVAGLIVKKLNIEEWLAHAQNWKYNNQSFWEKIATLKEVRTKKFQYLTLRIYVDISKLYCKHAAILSFFLPIKTLVNK